MYEFTQYSFHRYSKNFVALLWNTPDSCYANYNCVDYSTSLLSFSAMCNGAGKLYVRLESMNIACSFWLKICGTHIAYALNYFFCVTATMTLNRRNIFSHVSLLTFYSYNGQHQAYLERVYSKLGLPYVLKLNLEHKIRDSLGRPCADIL